MEKKTIGIYTITSAIIWGIVIIGCSLRLKGTGCYDEISTILYIGVFTHIILIWTPLAIQFKKKRN